MDPKSPLGLFLRKCRVVFLHLPFEAIVQLYMEVLRALEDARRPPGAPEEAGGSSRGRTSEASGRAGSSSSSSRARSLRERPAVEAFLNQELKAVEQQVCVGGEGG